MYPLLDADNSPGVYVIPGSPLIYLKDIDAIVLSDLHLGFEEAAARGLDYSYGRKTRSVGMFLPRIQLKRIIDILTNVFEIIKPKKLIINGDLKHAFDQLLKQESREIASLLDFIINNNIYEIVIIRGNHDNYLPIVLKKYGVNLYTRYEYVTSNYRLLITHGHLELDLLEYNFVIIGHEHPSIKCFGLIKTPVFIKIPFDKNKYIICIPAIGPYHPGTSISVEREKYLSPIIRHYGDLSRARVITWIELSLLYPVETRDIYSDFVSIRYYSLKSKEVALIEFSSIEIALTICGSLQ